MTGSFPAEIETVSSLQVIFNMFTDRIDLLDAYPRSIPAVRARRLAILFQEVADIFADKTEEKKELEKKKSGKKGKKGKKRKWILNGKLIVTLSSSTFCRLSSKVFRNSRF